MTAPVRLRISTLEGFASALLLALGAAPQVACDGGVQVEDGSGGAGASQGNGGASGDTVTSTGDANPMTTGSGVGGSSTGVTTTAGTGVTTSVSSTGTGSGGGSGGCINPTPVIIEGIDTGLDSCQGGNYRRREAVECPVAPPDPNQCCVPACGDGYFCNTGGEVACGCTPLCHTDADCGPSELCMCGAQAGQCVPAGCTTGADCDPGQECTSWDTTQGCLYPAFECTTPADSCGGDLDCAAAGEYCSLQPDGHRACVPGGCAIGRPFLVDDAARVAPLTRRDDWCAALAPRVSDLEPETRARLGAAWEHIAVMEHASIAAFARFALQLLSLGAPPELLVRTQEAMRDETEHTRLAFALASAYRGAPVGPARLSIDGAVRGDFDVAELVRLTVREGCVGETVAALEAGEGEAAAEDPAVRAVLGTIAVDEKAHAELAWSAVRWALETYGGDVRSVLREEIAALETELAGGLLGVVLGEGDREMARLGVTTPAVRAVLRAETIRKVVLPCLHALMAEPTGERIEPATAIDEMLHHTA